MMGHPPFPLTDPVLIFFIPGNPGLISYYHLFLSLLASNLSSEDSTSDGRSNGFSSGGKVGYLQPPFRYDHPQVYIHGKSLAGFEIQTSVKTSEGGKLYGLREQIEFVEKELENCVNRWQDLVSESSVDEPETENKRAVCTNVILIGHSVGSYIAMEILRRHRERRKKPSGDVNQPGHRIDIVGGVLLFPTVVDIAKSPSGKILTVRIYAIYFIEMPSAFFFSLVSSFSIFPSQCHGRFGMLHRKLTLS
jgi:pimeloyl-ACP methyl ester carboxylesterase